MSNFNPKRWFKLLLVNLLVFAALCEVGAYLAYPLIYSESLDRAALQKSLHQESGRQRTEESSNSEPWLPTLAIHPYFGFIYRTGPFHSDNLHSEASPDRVIIAWMGGSVARAVYDRARGEFVAELQQYEAFSGKEIVIHPMSLHGFKQPQQLMALTYYMVEGFHFDYVVNLDGFNEIVLPVSENRQIGIALSFPRLWRHFLNNVYDAEVLDTILAIRVQRNRREEIRSFFARRVLRSSAFCLFTWRVLDDRANTEIYKLNSDLLSKKKNTTLPDYVRGPAKEYPDELAAVRDAARIWKNASEKMALLCDAAGIEYLHFLQPNQYVPGSKTLNAEERAIAYLGEDSVNYRLISYGYPLLSEAGAQLRAEGLNFYDLTYLYQDESQTIYIDVCCHMNDTGYEIIAREIARVMGSN